jgi:hypothetical protein
MQREQVRNKDALGKLGHEGRNQNAKRRRFIAPLVVVLLAVAVVVFAAVWLAGKAVTIRAELTSASELLPKLKAELMSEDAASATGTLESLKFHTSAARTAAADPLWGLAGTLPWIGDNFQAATEISTGSDELVRLGAEPLVGLLKTTDWDQLIASGTSADLKPLVSAQPRLDAASYAIKATADRFDNIDTTNLLQQVSEPLLEAQKELGDLRGDVEAAADFAKLAPLMLGADEPRRYLLLVQNNAEVRATGGIPGALAVLTVSNGKFSLDSQASAGSLGTFSPLVAVDSEQQSIYSTRLGKFMQDVNLTPDFPTAAATAQAMWEKRTGLRTDGVVSVDPVALSYILTATGPIHLKESELAPSMTIGLPTELSGENVVRTLLSDVYAKIADTGQQDAYFASVAEEIFGALSTGGGDAKELVEGVARATGEHRIQLWSADQNHQAIINKYALSGAISGPSISPAQFGVYFNDGTGAKMDYYVKRTVQLVKECARDGYEQTTVRITSTNTAPADAGTSLPEYVTGNGVFGIPPGSVQTNIVAYGPAQATIETAQVNGQKKAFAPYVHSNRPVGVVAVRLAPGESQTVEFAFGKIVQHTEPDLVVTPTVQLVKDVALPMESASCG